jgi:hypothetical protein
MRKHVDILREEKGYLRAAWYGFVGAAGMMVLGEWLRPGYWPAILPTLMAASCALAFVQWRWHRVRKHLNKLRNRRREIRNKAGRNNAGANRDFN